MNLSDCKIHGLEDGVTLCRLDPKDDKGWPSGDKYVSSINEEYMSCENCLAVLDTMAQKKVATKTDKEAV